MRASALRQLMTVQRKVQLGVTSLNEPNMVWADWRPDLPCEVEVRRGREHFDAQTKKRYAEDVWLFRVRYDEIDGIDPTMQVLYDGMKFDIRSPRPDAQFGRDCIIECTVQNAVIRSAPLSISIKGFIAPGAVGDVYKGFTVSADGGTEPYTFAIAAGVLPPGLSMTADVVSGTPAQAGTFAVSIQVTDQAGDATATPSFNITIAE